MRAALSVVILTLNEEARIARALRSVGFADEVVVLDAGSSDRTCEIASKLGARVVEQPWLGWAEQRNQGAALARHDWILIVDADEIVTPELARSVLAALEHADPQDGFALDRRDEFFGDLIPNIKNRTRRQALVRLFNRRHSRYDPAFPIHEEVAVPGRRLLLDGLFLHWRNFTFAEQMHRYVDNAGLEAVGLERRGARATPLRLIGWPLLRFAWVYARTWRCGTRGLVVAAMMSVAEFCRQAALWERQRVRPALDPPGMRDQHQPRERHQ